MTNVSMSRSLHNLGEIVLDMEGAEMAEEWRPHLKHGYFLFKPAFRKVRPAIRPVLDTKIVRNTTRMYDMFFL